MGHISAYFLLEGRGMIQGHRSQDSFTSGWALAILAHAANLVARGWNTSEVMRRASRTAADEVRPRNAESAHDDHGPSGHHCPVAPSRSRSRPSAGWSSRVEGRQRRSSELDRLRS